MRTGYTIKQKYGEVIANKNGKLYFESGATARYNPFNDTYQFDNDIQFEQKVIEQKERDRIVSKIEELVSDIRDNNFESSHDLYYGFWTEEQQERIIREAEEIARLARSMKIV